MLFLSMNSNYAEEQEDKHKYSTLIANKATVGSLVGFAYVRTSSLCGLDGHDPQHGLGHRQLVITSISVITVTRG